jgi:pimeloyl-ACP methyl ester carboxylesterase
MPVDRSIRLSDGRRLGYAEYGDPEGRALLYCHGFRASRFEAALLDATARKTRVRVVAADRPGYGLSDFRPGRRIGDWPGDVVELTDALGIDRFSILGAHALTPVRYVT